MNNSSSSSHSQPEDSIESEHLPTIAAADPVVGEIDRNQAQTLLAASEQRYISLAETYAQAEAERDAEGQIIGYTGTLTDVSAAKRNEAVRKQAEHQLQALIEGTAATTGNDYFPALASHIAKALNVSYALVTEKVEDKLSVLAFWANDSLQSTFAYPIADTPCQQALQQGQYYCESLVQKKFPADLDLVEMGAESYLGIALQDAQGKAIGNLLAGQPDLPTHASSSSGSEFMSSGAATMLHSPPLAR